MWSKWGENKTRGGNTVLRWSWTPNTSQRETAIFKKCLGQKFPAHQGAPTVFWNSSSVCRAPASSYLLLKKKQNKKPSSFSLHMSFFGFDPVSAPVLSSCDYSIVFTSSVFQLGYFCPVVSVPSFAFVSYISFTCLLVFFLAFGIFPISRFLLYGLCVFDALYPYFDPGNNHWVYAWPSVVLLLLVLEKVSKKWKPKITLMYFFLASYVVCIFSSVLRCV